MRLVVFTNIGVLHAQRDLADKNTSSLQQAPGNGNDRPASSSRPDYLAIVDEIDRIGRAQRCPERQKPAEATCTPVTIKLAGTRPIALNIESVDSDGDRLVPVSIIAEGKGSGPAQYLSEPRFVVIERVMDSKDSSSAPTEFGSDFSAEMAEFTCQRTIGGHLVEHSDMSEQKGRTRCALELLR